MLDLNLVVEEAFVEVLAENFINGEFQQAVSKPHYFAYVSLSSCNLHMF